MNSTPSFQKLNARCCLIVVPCTIGGPDPPPLFPEPINPLYGTSQPDPCSGYDGVLRIRSGDTGAAAGTVFFLYMVNQLIYAEMYNLLPWAFFDDTSHRVYDEEVHRSGPHASFSMIRGRIVEDEQTRMPSTPLPPRKYQDIEVFNIEGSGIWESYFEPLSRFSPFQNRICRDDRKPLYEISYDGVAVGIHTRADWAVRAWGYGDTLKIHRHSKVRDWYRPMRQRGASIVRRYIKPKPWIRQLVDEANPLPSGYRCLAMHVRTTDKARSGGRAEVHVNEYLRHVMQFLSETTEGKVFIYLATDSSKTIKSIQELWPKEVVNLIRKQGNVFLSNSSEPTFDLTSHHRTNTEVLVDIYAMAKCSKLLHGRSAVSEAVFYVNPELREASVDIDGDQETLHTLMGV
eukprot:Nitzschia sp. Nitz4//scaffold55_size114948//82757//84007//NITZ4_003914-RA/size114948-snap-gene-0.190-mRNA-1//-1//CDS//3329554569//7870//frame0